MPTPTPNNKFELQDFNSNLDTWGVDHLNPVISAIDQALDGVLSINVAGASPYVMNAVDYVAAPFRNRVIRFTGTRGTKFNIDILLGDSTTNKSYIIVNNSNTSIYVNESEGLLIVPPDAMYFITITGGQILAGASLSAPLFSPVVDGISTAPSISITPTLNGQAFVINPSSSVSNINIEDVFENAEFSNENIGYNFLCVGSNAPGPYNITVTGLCNSFGVPLTETVTIRNPFANLRLGWIPGTRKVCIVGGYGYEVA